jgi:hypothetical protein
VDDTSLNSSDTSGYRKQHTVGLYLLPNFHGDAAADAWQLLEIRNKLSVDNHQ